MILMPRNQFDILPCLPAGRNLKIKNKNSCGFTLIELLIVMAIMAVLATISIIALSSSRAIARDARRKADLESIRSALELYRSDCNTYRSTLPAAGAAITGSGTPTSCVVGNVYLTSMPTDPQSPTRTYFYSTTGTTYMLCASLEQAPNPPLDTTGCGSCGSSACNYKVTSP